MINCQFENGNKANLRHVTVDAIVLSRDKTQILLAKRAEGTPDAGKWCLPGGYMERDETTKQTAERETLEETGYEITDIKFLAFNDNPQRVGGESQNVNFLYTAIAADIALHIKARWGSDGYNSLLPFQYRSVDGWIGYSA